MTELQLEKLTRMILITVAVAIFVCLAQELKASTFEYIVKCETRNIQEQKRVWDARVRRNLGLGIEQAYDTPIYNDVTEPLDVW